MSEETQTKNKHSRKKELSKIRRKNASLFPIYKMFSWDLLFFYSIEFLFYTITKKVTASQVLMINGFYLAFRVLCQIPAFIISDTFGKCKSIIIGNFLLIAYMITLLFMPGAMGIIIADLFFALGYDIKLNTETNLLYDSVSTKGGEGLYSKLDARGGSLYYILDGIASFTAGYLFVINNYLPLIICLGFIIISTILSFQFKDIYPVKPDSKKKLSMAVKDNLMDLKKALTFIFKSKRMRSFVFFQIVFYGLIKIMEIYQSDLLIEIGIPEEQFSMIFAFLILISGISLSMKKPIEKRYKNRTLTVLSLGYVGACVAIGTISSLFTGSLIIPIILILYAVQKMTVSIWYILESKYLKNFTTESNRTKISFAYETIGGISASIYSILGGLLLDFVSIENAYLIVGLASLALIVIALDYMRTRFGLRPKDYKKEDIAFDDHS